MQPIGNTPILCEYLLREAALRVNVLECFWCSRQWLFLFFRHLIVVIRYYVQSEHFLCLFQEWKTKADPLSWSVTQQHALLTTRAKHNS